MNLVNFLHKFSFAGVSGFSLDVGPAAQLGLGAVVPGHEGCHAVSRRDQSLVVDTTFVAENNNFSVARGLNLHSGQPCVFE